MRLQIALTALIAIAPMLWATGGTAAELDLLPSIIVSPSNTKVKLQSVASIAVPGDMAPLLDGTGRMLVGDLGGTLRMIDGGTVTTYHVQAGSQTLLDRDTAFTSVALHPGFSNPASPGYKKFYSLEPEKPGTAIATFSPQFSSTGATYHHQNVLYEYTVANPAANTIGSFTKREIMRANNPLHNHNTNDLVFDANGLLYIGVGDGGNQVTNRQNAPSLATVYGKVLRIDPLGLQGTLSSNGQYSTPVTNPFASLAGAHKEIFTYGNRNPYRLSIDAVTGNLYIGEVGQDNVEEVNVVPNVYSAISGGQNFGWASKEGSIKFPSLTADPDMNGNGNGDFADANGLVDPVLDYDHQDGADIIGGFVYRGALFPELYGKYIFADSNGPRENGAEYPVPNNQARFFYGDVITGEMFQFNLAASSSSLPTDIYSVNENAQGEIYVLGVGGVFSRRAELPGDFNHDGAVNSSDYVVWRKTSSNVASYNLWRANYGNSLSGMAAELAAVPEPTCMALCLYSIGALLFGRRRRSSRIPGQ